MSLNTIITVQSYMSFINVDVFIRICLTYNIHVKKYRKTRNINTIWITDQVSRTNFGIQDFSLILKFVPFRMTFFATNKISWKKIYHHLFESKIIFPKVSAKGTKDCFFYFIFTYNSGRYFLLNHNYYNVFVNIL